MAYFFGKSVFAEDTNFLAILAWELAVVIMVVGFCTLMIADRCMDLGRRAHGRVAIRQDR